MAEERDVLILGGGLTGLAAASVLGEHATVLEQDDRPGGLVRTECFQGYWFDRVIHILHFQDVGTERRIKELLGEVLLPCPPEAWVETASGTVRYPIQMHLGGLDSETVVRCLHDLAKVTFGPSARPPNNFEEMLLQTFGEGLCDLFLLPYNRKVWKRPLDTLAPTGFQWTITHPDFEKVLLGAISPNSEFQTYNANGWYPRPPLDAPVRGMEVLSRQLAQQVQDLRLQHRITEIDLESRTICAEHEGQAVDVAFRKGCCATIPLPKIVQLCRQAPLALRRACATLPANRVLSVALSIQGPRPEGCGHWRYYSNESVSFTRLVYMHRFDPGSAPKDGWGLLVEIPEPAEMPLRETHHILNQVRREVQAVGAIPNDCRIIDEHLMVIDPAYVVFTVESQKVMEEARAWLLEQGITPLGRYGRWEYSSMAQVLRDGFAWGETMAEQIR